LPALAPSRLILAGALTATVLVAGLMWIASQSPWFGIELQARQGELGVQVTAVDPQGPSAGRLKPGDVITGLATSTGEVTAIDALTIARSGHLFQSFASVHRFMAGHRTMFEAARHGTVRLVLDSGQHIAIDASPSRPVRALPVDFWLTTALATVALFAAFGVFAFRGDATIVRIFCVGSVGFVLTQSTAAVIFGRELVFDPDWGRLAVQLNLGSRLLTYWTLVMMLWTHPRPFGTLKAGVPIAAVFGLAWLGEALEWWPHPNMATPAMATLTTLVVAPALGLWQWRATRHLPLERAVVKVLLLSFAVPTLLLTLSYQLPRLFGRAPLIDSIPALSAINMLMFVGFALGIARFRLFQLDRWWFETLLWALGGALVVALDMLLLWFNASGGLALGLALALAGWAYFPLRQWIWRRFDRSPGQSIERHLTRLVEQLLRSGSHAELESRWRALLDDVFRPATMAIRPEPAVAPMLDAEGQRLVVPGLAQGEAIVLEHAAKATRLFGPADVGLAAELLSLGRRTADARLALDQQQAEREAMVQELHDGLGGIASNIALLAGMAQRDDAAPKVKRALGTIESLAAESLSEIRGFMHSLDMRDADWEAVAADLRAESGSRVEAHGLVFQADFSLHPACPPPEPLLRLNLPRLCQEAITNIVKHASASRVYLTLEVTPKQLHLVIADDGRGLPDGIDSAGLAASAARSRGLGIMRRRAHQLGGTLDFVRGPGTTILLTVPLPLQSPATGMAASHGAG
jgi:signal transduction histidine kinase